MLAQALWRDGLGLPILEFIVLLSYRISVQHRPPLIPSDVTIMHQYQQAAPTVLDQIRPISKLIHGDKPEPNNINWP